MSVSGYIGRLLDVSNKKSLASFLGSWEFGKMLLDGNLAHNILFRGPSGNLVGTDYHGNKYYENNTHTYARRRWVVFADKFDYNITSVPPEWHGWLNYINDYNPTQHKFKQPIYQIEAYVTRTGTPKAYNPKGSWFNPQKRNWKKYEEWTPEQKA
ncbi:hypothetical protein Vretimale_2124 [Volvox reticuliferus]|uniref:NADH dehydrogenase [ubiquinone] 1 alpha subcomplex subunit 12 n=1 Tax=Volvox reticuliferus TaxID=1737510 RepID=A0A8J4D685_9CHLO|nr:hypothetical protein Vretifemale_4401 [Volvox reticuliferus]GIL96280.1 hypothetical protein Vretimale_2124 [Volvox reticuliferus]